MFSGLPLAVLFLSRASLANKIFGIVVSLGFTGNAAGLTALRLAGWRSSYGKVH